MSSKTVDERVVEMKFNCKQFESGVSSTMSLLDRLKEKLKFNDSEKGFNKIIAVAKKVDLSPILEASEKVISRFSALGTMATTVLTNITNKIVSTGEQLLNSFTLEPILSGFQEYETQINAIQTIQANTSSKGTTMNQITDALDELNHYADMTIYNFTEMTRNIGTFTAAGIDLDTSVSAIKGIANLAAVSGSNSQQASTAMYQLSQALAAGTVKLQDWNSVVNAGMGGATFQESLKETSRILGTGCDEWIEKEGSFRDSLTDGWLTSEVLLKTLEKFTGDLTKEELLQQGYTEAQADAIMQMGETANNAATKVKTFTQLIDTLKEAAQSGWTQSWNIIIGNFEEAKELFTMVSDKVSAVLNATADARNATLQSWKDMGGRTKLIEALTAAFRTLYNMIEHVTWVIGRIYKPITAKQLTNLCDQIIKICNTLESGSHELSKPALAVKGILKGIVSSIHLVQLAAQGLIIALSPVIKIVLNVLDTIIWNINKVGRAIYGVDKSVEHNKTFIKWGNKVAATLTDIINKLIKFGKKVKTEVINKLTELNKKYKIIDKFKTLINKITELLTPLKEKFNDVITAINNGAIDETVTNIFEKIADIIDRSINALSSAYTKMAPYLSKIKTVVTALGNDLYEVLSGSGDIVQKFVDNLKSLNHVTLDDVGALFKNLFKQLLDYFLTTGEKLTGFKTAISDFKTSVQSDLKKVASTATGFKSVMAKVIETITEKFHIGFGEIFAVVFGVATAKSIKTLSAAITKLVSPLNALISIPNSIAGVLTGVKTVLMSFSKVINAAALVGVAIAIGILVASIVALSQVDTDSLSDTMPMLAMLAAGLIAITEVLNSLGGNKLNIDSGGGGEATKKVLMVVAIAGAMLLLVAALEKLSKIDGALAVIGKMALLMAGLVGVVFLIGKFSDGKDVYKTTISLIAISVSLGIMVDALSEVSSMSLGTIVKSMILLLSVIAALKLVLASISKLDAGSWKSMVSMLALVAAFTAFIVAFKIFASLDITGIKSTLKSFAIIMASFVALMVASKFAGKYAAQGGAAVLLMSAAIIVMTKAFDELSRFDPSELNKCTITLASMLGCFAVLVGVSNFAGENAAKAGAMLLLVSASIAVLVAMIVVLSHIDTTGVIKGTAAIAVLLGMFALVIAATKGANDCKQNLIMMSIAIGILAASIGVLAMIDSTSLAVATACLGSLMGMLSLMIAMTGKAKAANATIILLGVVVAALGGVLYLMAKNLPSDSYTTLIASAAGLSLLLIAMSAALKILSTIKTMSAASMAAIGILTLLVAELGAILVLIAQYMPTGKVTEMVTSVLSISTLLLAMSACCVILSTIPTVSATAIVAMAALTIIVAGLGAILGYLSQMQLGSTLELAASLSLLIISLSSSCRKLAIAGKYGAAGYNGVGILATVIAAMTALAVGIGALMEYFPSVKTFLDDGLPVFQQIGEAIGEFFGGLIEGVFEALNDLLPDLGQSLSDFATNVQPFTEAMSNIDSSVYEGVVYLADAITDIGGASLKTTLKTLCGLTLSKLKETLDTLAEAVVSFSTTINEGDIDLDQLTVASEAASTIAGLANAIAGLNGKSLSNFIKYVGTDENGDSIGSVIAEFSAAVKGKVDKKSVKNATEAGTLIANMASSIPNTGGFLADLVGDNDLGNFSDNIEKFADAITRFSRTVAGNVDLKSVKTATKAGTLIADMATNIPNSGDSLLSRIIGDNDLGTFSTEIPKFGLAIATFCSYTSGLDGAQKKAAERAVSIGKSVCDMANEIPNSGDSLLSRLIGDNDLGSFSTQITKFGLGLALFCDNVASIDDDAVTHADKAIAVGQSLAGFADSMNSDDSVWDDVMKIFGADTDLATFGSQIQTFGNGVTAFYTSVKDIDTEVLAGIDAELGNLVGTVSGIDDINSTTVADFATNLTTLGTTGVQAFISAFGDASVEAMNVGEKLMSSISAGILLGEATLNTHVSSIPDVLISTLTAKYYMFLDAGKAFIDRMCMGVQSKNAVIKNTFNRLISACISQIKSRYSEFFNAGQGAIDKLVSGISKKTSSAKNTISSMIGDCIWAIRDRYKEFYDAGTYFVEGFSNGIKDHVNNAKDQATEMAKAAANAVKKELDINSPSKVGYELGGFFGMGFTNSLDDYADTAYNSGESMAKSARDGLRNTIAAIGDCVNDSIDSQPTIRPVLDLSQVRSGAGKLSALLGSSKAASINASVNGRLAANNQNGDAGSSKSTNINFTQNNYSPKALSRIDIYRQTSNQFSALGGIITT